MVNANTIIVDIVKILFLILEVVESLQCCLQVVNCTGFKKKADTSLLNKVEAIKLSEFKYVCKMSNFETLLAEFDKTLQRFSPNIYKKLQPPLPNPDIQRLLKSIGIEDEDVYSLYKWKNGVSNELQQAMIFDFECTMLDLEKVEQLKTNYRLDSNNMEGLVILFDNQEDCLLFNTNRGKDYGKLHVYSVPLLSIESPFSYFDSLSSMFQTTTEQYKQGGLFYDEDSNFLVSNSEINIKIYETFNPISNFYNHESW